MENHFYHQKNLIILLSIVIIAFTFFTFLKILIPVFLAATAAIVLKPTTDKYAKKHSQTTSAMMATGIALGVFTAVVVIPAYLLFANFDALTGLVTEMSKEVERVGSQAKFGGFVDLGVVSNQIRADFTSNVIEIVTTAPSLAFDVLVFFMALFLLLRYSWGIEARVQTLERTHPELKTFVEKLHISSYNTLYVVYVVFFVIAIATAIMSIPFFWYLGYDNVILYSILAGVFSMIPFVGGKVVFIAVAIHQWFIGSTLGVIISIIFGLGVIYGIPELYIRPLLIGKKTDVDWMVMFIAIVGGILVLGVWGFVFGPLLVALTKTSYDALIDVYAKGKTTPEPPKKVP
jgi:predicted PurR-regulated permease PerM